MHGLTLEYPDRDTTPERLAALAAEHGISPEMLAMRAIEGYLGDYALREIPDDLPLRSLGDLLVARGLLKTTTTL